MAPVQCDVTANKYSLTFVPVSCLW